MAAVCAAPDDDAPRLVLADWLDIDGPPACRDAARAEFIRVQCQLAKLARGDDSPDRKARAGDSMWLFGYRTALCRELRFMAAFTEDPAYHDRQCELCLERRSKELADHHAHVWTQGVSASLIVFERGFVRTLGMAADNWLAHGDALSWSPEQTVEAKCTANRDPKRDLDNSLRYIFHRHCDRCNGTGTIRVPRPCPPTAQPVTEVRLTTELAVQRDGLSRWSFIGDPHGWRSEPFDPTWTLGSEYAAIAAEVIQKVCRLRWPAVKTWHLPPEPVALIRRENAEAGPVYDFGPQPAPD